jgi:hypothetical protein
MIGIDLRGPSEPLNRVMSNDVYLWGLFFILFYILIRN